MKKDWFNHKITLWQKFKLLFIKPMVSFDIGKGDETKITYYKILNNKFYFYDAAYSGYTKEKMSDDIREYRELIERYKKTPQYIEGKKLINNEENKHENN